jgi:hypothetical protein
MFEYVPCDVLLSLDLPVLLWFSGQIGDVCIHFTNTVFVSEMHYLLLNLNTGFSQSDLLL